MAEVGIRRRPKNLSRRVRSDQGVSTAPSPTASSWSCSARPAAASPPCCAWSPGWKPSAPEKCRIGGRVVNDLEPKDRDIAMVFQNYALYPHMTVFDNMAYGLQNPRHAEVRDRRAKSTKPPTSWNSAPSSTAARASFPAASASASPWAAPSCGSRRSSCSTSRCPTSTPNCGCRCGSKSSRLQDRLGITSLYVTHDQVEAMTLADRMMVMNGGVAEQIGTPMEVYHRPASTFVAGFIGSPAMNFLPATLTAEGVELRGGHKVPLSNALGGSASTGREVTLGIRPEHLTARDRPRHRRHRRPSRIGRSPRSRHRSPRPLSLQRRSPPSPPARQRQCKNRRYPPLRHHPRRSPPVRPRHWPPGVIGLQARFPDTPWRQIIGIRNVIAHDYLGIRLSRKGLTSLST